MLCALFVLAIAGCFADSPKEILEDYCEFGVRYLNEGNYSEAVIAFTAAIEIDSKNTDAYIGRAKAYIGCGETENNLSLAMSDYEAVIGIDSSISQAYLGIADIYIRQGEYEEAIKVLKNVPDNALNDEIKEKLAELDEGNISDSDGKTRKSCHYENGEPNSRFVVESDENGRRFKESCYWYDGEEYRLDYYVEYIWNDDGSYGGYNLFDVED